MVSWAFQGCRPQICSLTFGAQSTIRREPSAPSCKVSGGRVSCPTDAEGVNAVTKLRAALPKGRYLLSTASFHVGTYGEGAFAGSLPVTSYTGINLAMARSAAGQSLDLINIMRCAPGAGARAELAAGVAGSRIAGRSSCCLRKLRTLF
jgi:hypothetical protein